MVILYWAAKPVTGQDFSRLRAIAGSTHGFTADFSYTVSSAFWDGTQVSNGTFVLQGPRYRVETNTEIILSHGPDTYIYRPLEDQVLITTGTPEFSPSALFGQFEEHYEVAGVESAVHQGARQHVVRLLPRTTETSIVEIKIWMRIQDSMITRIQSLDSNDTTMDFRLSNINLSPRIGPGTFDLSFPESAEIIDLRS